MQFPNVVRVFLPLATKRSISQRSRLFPWQLRATPSRSSFFQRRRSWMRTTFNLPEGNHEAVLRGEPHKEMVAASTRRPSFFKKPRRIKEPCMTTRERKVRKYASHLGLMVRESNGVFALVERYGEKRRIGTYRSVDTLERGIKRYGDRTQRELH